MKLTDIEIEIIEFVEQNPESSIDMISKSSYREPEVVAKTFKTLQKKGILYERSYFIDWDKVDSSKHIVARIDVKVTPNNETGFDQLAEKIASFEHVESLCLISGSYDLSLTIKGHTMRDISHFVATQLASLESVQETATFFIMKKYKYDYKCLTNKCPEERLTRFSL